MLTSAEIDMVHQYYKNYHGLHQDLPTLEDLHRRFLCKDGVRLVSSLHDLQQGERVSSPSPPPRRVKEEGLDPSEEDTEEEDEEVIRDRWETEIEESSGVVTQRRTPFDGGAKRKREQPLFDSFGGVKINELEGEGPEVMPKYVKISNGIEIGSRNTFGFHMRFCENYKNSSSKAYDGRERVLDNDYSFKTAVEEDA